MTELAGVNVPTDITFGRDPYLDAWLLNFMTENNLEYLLNPLVNASSEQLRFMVVLEENQVFIPCSDDLFRCLLARNMEPGLQEMYNTVWRIIVRMVREHCSDTYRRRKILQFCRHRFQLCLSSHILIPSRLMKRLTNIVTTQSGLEDPYRNRKRAYNKRAQEFLQSGLMDQVVQGCPAMMVQCEGLDQLRLELDLLELQRLLYLSSWSSLWKGRETLTSDRISRQLAKPCKGFDTLRDILGSRDDAPGKVLYIANASGGILFDILIIKVLLRRGLKVMLALKDGFYYQTPTIWDQEHDPVLEKALDGIPVIQEDRLTKNELLDILRRNPFVVISDGMGERLNLYRASVTFARAWKEADLVIAKDDPHVSRLIKTSHQFTRDILVFERDSDKQYVLHHKPKAEHVHKFSEGDLTDMADTIIDSMRQASHQGRTVMFYSAVVGSIPGQTKTAIKVLNTFVEYLRSRLEGAFIINPAEHFEDGMDGDDLMFMWERVQRSGLIQVWRFQSVQDIEKSFELMGEKVPPVWAGKDSTYSTGCTKEMHIALEVQRKHPELQIIGPSSDRFFRRREYGVGKYFDAGIEYQ